MDVQKFLDYYAILVLVSDGDSARHNIYLVHDLAADKWELVPWDLEGAYYGGMDAPIDMGTQQHPVYPGGWNMLRTRVLAVPEFHAYYCRRLAQYMDTIYADDVMASRIADTYNAVKQDGVRDWRKVHGERNATFLAARAG